MYSARLLYCLVVCSVLLTVKAYSPLSNSFLRNISSGGFSDFDPNNGTLLSPILIPRGLGTAGHATVQRHFVDFFNTQLPKWTTKWYNSTATTLTGDKIPIKNLLFQREPPWTKTGQANWLTLAAHYDSKKLPEGFIGATGSAVPCAMLMHVARSIDRYMTQMHDEMAELGEGGEVAMDMGVQILFIDGKENLEDGEPALYGSKALAELWEKTGNPGGKRYGYPNALGQINLFLLLDYLGTANPIIPSYLTMTHWAHQKMASLEKRLRGLSLLETNSSSAFLPETEELTMQTEINDHNPFMDRGVPFLQIVPSPLPPNHHSFENNGANLDLPTVRDWVRIITGFTMEWLDMMEVWADETK